MEKEDYYIENGDYVFTAHYHLKRGYCCGSGCRHCPYLFDQKQYRVISLVPSWTETLIDCGIDVVGRTRFCVHPEDKVESIPFVGGTKHCHFAKVNNIKADFVILDKEENPKEFADEISHPILVSHVTDFGSFIDSLKEMNCSLNSSRLNELTRRAVDLQGIEVKNAPWYDLPGVIEWVKRPPEDTEIDKIVYVIWKDPWMMVSKSTFIGSQLTMLGFGSYLDEKEDSYPEFQLEGYDVSRTLFLFSSEPYRFDRELEELKKLGVYGAIVDGEGYGWFGIRGLGFLEQNLKVSHEKI